MENSSSACSSRSVQTAAATSSGSSISVAWHRHERDTAALRAAFAKQLQADLAQMYRARCFSDGCIVTSKGVVEFHQALLETRCPRIWHLFQELALLQEQTGLLKVSSVRQSNTEDTDHPKTTPPAPNQLTLHLPDVQHSAIEQFVVSIYESSEVKEVRSVTKGIIERKEWLKQLCELKRRRIPLQPLGHTASQQLHQQIWQKLQQQNTLERSGGKSPEPFRLFSAQGDQKCRQDNCTNSNVASHNKVTFQSLRQNKVSASLESVSSTSETPPRCASVNINYTDSATKSSDSLNLNPPPPIEIVDLDTYLLSCDSSGSRKRSNTITLKKGGKKPRRIVDLNASSKRRAECGTVKLKVLEAPSCQAKAPKRFRKCLNSGFFASNPNMEHNNLQHDMNVSSVDQDKQDARGNTKVYISKHKLDFIAIDSPLKTIDQSSGQKLIPSAMSTDPLSPDCAPSPIEIDEASEELVDNAFSYAIDVPEIDPHNNSLGIMRGSVSDADLANAEEIKSFPSVRAKVEHLENISKNFPVPRSGGYKRTQSCSDAGAAAQVSDLRGLFPSADSNSNRVEAASDTSSLEVEPASSQDESLGNDSSPVAPSDASEQTTASLETAGVSSPPAAGGESRAGNNPSARKPLVRTRTFEIIEPQIAPNTTNNNQSSVAKLQPPNEDEVPIRQKEEESHLAAERLPHASVQRDGGGIPISHQELDNPDRIRERERMQGSLLFEHNFQTFSNIPTTNMMTASMMTGSLSSESSMGLGSLFSSTIDGSIMSMASTSGGMDPSMVESMSRPPSVAMSSMCVTFDEEPCYHPNLTAQVPEPSPLMRIAMRCQDGSGSSNHGFNARELKTLSKVSDHSSRSASPDSLSVDQRAKSFNSDHIEADSLMSARADLKCSVDSSASGAKEDLDDEEKERDDLETLEMSAADTDSSITQMDHSVPCDGVKPFFQVSSGVSSLSGSPRIIRRAEHTPILSGGSTLKRELSSEGKSASEGKSFDRQISTSSVKDVDAIPLVCGYIEEDDEANAKDKTKEKPDAQPQPIFSMFIDLKELPSPEKEKKLEPVSSDKAKAQQPQSVYMFIEADAPSPKSKRKSFTEEIPSVKPTSNKSVVASKVNEIVNSPVVTEKPPHKEMSHLVMNGDERSHLKNSDPGVDDSNDASSAEKKGFFMFIEADTPSTSGSPKTRRKPLLTQKKTTKEASVMSKSAPSDVLLMATKSQTPEKLCSKPLIDGDELMTKSVIDRKEFMEQPVTKRNVSLKDNINESAASPRHSREGFVSGIPRPIHLLKSKSCSKVPVRVGTRRRPEYPRPRLPPGRERRPTSARQADDKRATEQTETAAEPRQLSTDLCSSLTESLSDVAALSLPLDDASSVASDASSLLAALDKTRSPGSEDRRSSGCCKLGEELLRMFEEEIKTDVVIQVGERRIKAHKCILASRCVYFAALLAGRWPQHTSNVIKLAGFSPSSVTLALRHIYSGESSLPAGENAEEVAALADMLALDGLKDVVALHLRAEKCHYFHKPCVGGCIEGVLETLVMCTAYCMEELHAKCLRWLARHFAAVLPTKQFAQLSRDLQQRCLNQMRYDMSVGSVLDTVVGASRVLSSLPVVKWAQPTFTLTTELLEAATTFIAANLSAVVDTDKFILACGGAASDVSGGVEEAFVASCRQVAAPDQAVLAHIRLTSLMADQSQEQEIQPLLEKLVAEVEGFLAHNVSRASVCRQWPLLPAQVQRRIKLAAPAALHSTRYSGPPSQHRPRLGSLGSKPTHSSFSDHGTAGVVLRRHTATADHRLARSASASAVPPALHHSTSRQSVPLPQRSRPVSVSTPPPTRASTLRARQAAMTRAGTKTSDGSSTDESRSPRPQQRGGLSRPHTPSSRPTSRPVTPAHQPPSLRRGGPPSRPASMGPASGSEQRPSKTIAQLNSTNNNKVVNGSSDCISGPDDSHTQGDSSRTSVPPPPGLPTRSRTFLKEERS